MRFLLPLAERSVQLLFGERDRAADAADRFLTHIGELRERKNVMAIGDTLMQLAVTAAAYRGVYIVDISHTENAHKESPRSRNKVAIGESRRER